jgi:hypothetical protein
LRSTVLGAVIAKLNGEGTRTSEYVYAGGERIAEWHITPWNRSIEWQHKNPHTGSWVSVHSVSSGFTGAMRTETDPTGRVTGNIPFFIPPDPPQHAPRETFFVIEGPGPINAELGMQLYEDRYINRIYDGGAGPGQQSEGEFWAERQRELEWQIQTGGRLLFGIDRLNANVPGGSHELVNESVDTTTYVMTLINGEWHPVPTATTRDASYFRLIPGSQSPEGGRGSRGLNSHHASFLQTPQKTTSDELTTEQLEQFKSCLSSMFKVYYQDHHYDRNGEAYFDGHSDTRAPWSIFKVGTFRVRTDQQSYSSTQLQQKFGPLAGGFFGKGTVVGYTDRRSPFVNAISNDAGSILKGREFLGLWMYELGNALSVITGFNPDVPADARDRYGIGGEPGAAFSDCVFGGAMSWSGSIERPRN